MKPQVEPDAPVTPLVPGAPASTNLRHVAAVWLFIALGVGVPLATLLGVDARASLVTMVPAWLIVAYCALRLSLLSGHGEIRLVSMTFWIFTYVWMGIAPLVQQHTGFPWPGQYSARRAVFGFVVVLLGLLAFDLGRRLPRLPAHRVREWVTGRRVAPSRAVFIGVLTTIVSSYLILRLGGIETFLASRRDVYLSLKFFADTEFQDRLEILRNLLVVPPFVAMYLLWWLWLRRRERLSLQARVGLVALLVATVLVNLLVNNPVNSARYWVGTIVLSVAFTTLRWRADWSFGVWVVVLVAILLIVFPYTDVFRSSIDLSNFENQAGPIGAGADYDAFQQLLNAVDHVSEEGFAYGKQMAGGFLFWLPRRVWEDKPVSTGSLVAEHLGYDFTNLSMPLWGEAYVDGGLLLVVFVFLGYGYFVQGLEEGFLQQDSSSERVLNLLVPLFAAYQIILLRGPLMSSFAYLVPVVALLFAITRVAPRTSDATMADAGAASRSA